MKEIFVLGEKETKDTEEYRVKCNYGSENLDECLLKIVRFKISQILHDHENIVT